MIKTTPEQNKTLVLQAFDTLFNKRDPGAVPNRRDWSEPAMDRGILEFIALF